MGLSDIVTFAPHRAYCRFVVAGTQEDLLGTISSRSIFEIQVCLQTANWELLGPVQATGYAQFSSVDLIPYGNDLVGTGAMVFWQGNAMWLWTPGLQTPPPGTVTFVGVVYPVIPVVTGGSPAATLNQLAGAMSFGGFTAFAINDTTIVVEANILSLPGTMGNGFPIQGNESITTGSTATFGGGWTLQSNTELSLGGAPGLVNANRAYFEMTVSSVPCWLGGTAIQQGTDVIQFAAQVVGASAGNPFVYQLAIGNWMLIANDYDAFFFVLNGTTPIDLNFGHNTLWFITPLIQPTGQAVPNFAAAIAYGAAAQSSDPVAMWINSDYLLGAWGQFPTPGGGGGNAQGGFSLETFRYPFASGELFTEAGQSVLQPAIVAMAAVVNQQSRWVGFIADAFVDSHFSAPYAIAALQAGDSAALLTVFRAVAALDSGNNTVDTLWLVSGEPDTSGSGGGNGGGNGGSGGGPGGGGSGNPPNNNIVVAPNPLNILVQQNLTSSGTVSVSSPSNTPITISAGFIGPGWITITAQSGTQVSAGVSVAITITANATGIGTGVVTGTLTVTPVGFAPVSVMVNVGVFAGSSGTGGTGLSGTCTTVGPSVYQESGNIFTTSMVGGPILIAGNAYTVTGFLSALAITVAPNPPAQTNVPWNT